MDIRQYLAILFRWFWLIALCGLVAAGGAYVVTSRTPKVYASTATVLVNAPVNNTTQFTDSGLRTTERLLGTYGELMISRPVLEQVIANLNLPVSASALAGRVQVEVAPNTLLIQLTVEDSSPERAAQIANEIPRVLNDQEGDLLANPYVSGYRQALNVIEVALPRPTPVRPDPIQAMLLSLVAGLALGVAVSLLIEHLDDTVKTAEDVNRVTGLPTLTSIGHIRGSDHAGRLVTANDPRSPTAEAYRMFLAHLAYSRADEKPIRTLLVASPGAGEGKSTNIANLGIAIAQTGRRVILVDMDLRNPTLHRFFKRTNQKGVTTALQRAEGESLSAGNHLISTGIEQLQLLPSGPLPSNPARLFGSSQIAELLRELESQADIVLIDSPSALAVVDAMLLARNCDAALLVARAKSTRSDNLRRAAEMVAQSGVFMLGVLLNNASSAQRARYYADEQGGGGGRGLRALFRPRQKMSYSPEVGPASRPTDLGQD